MKTKAVGNCQRFFNIFTRQGRKINDMCRKFNADGMEYLRERTLPDKSRVMLGYENSASKTDSFACRVNPDCSVIQKSYQNDTIFNLFHDKNRCITKLKYDSAGKLTERENKTMLFRGDTMLGRMKYYLSKKLLKQTYEGSYTDILETSGRLTKAYRRLTTTPENTNLYSIFEYADGIKEYKKNIGGTEYIFRTAQK